MTPKGRTAEIRTTTRPGEIFQAEEAVLEARLVTAVGRWVRGQAEPLEPIRGPRQRFTWPVEIIVQIEWLDES